MPFTVETARAESDCSLQNKRGGALERSLFAPVYDGDFNGEECSVAVQLDGEKALKWWHRNVARQQYGIQGWKRHRIYPDFIFAMQRHDGSTRITVLETKGDQLDNADTDYKRRTLEMMTVSFTWDGNVSAGELALVKNTGETVACELILMSEINAKLPLHFA